MRHTTIRTYFPIILIILVGFTIRLVAAAHQPLFFDEGYGIYDAVFGTFPFNNDYPPLYPVFLNIWLFGSKDLFWIRFPGVLSGTLSIFLIWRMCMRYLDKWAALPAAGLLAVSALSVHYSWLARPSAFIELYTICSVMTALRIHDELARTKTVGTNVLLRFIIINTIGSFTVWSFTIFVFAEIVTLFIFHRSILISRIGIRSQKTFLLLLLTVIPITQFMLLHSQFTDLRDGSSWIAPFGPQSVTATLLAIMNMSPLLNGELYVAPQSALWTLMVFLVLAGIAYDEMLKRYTFVRVLFWASIVSSITAAVTITGLYKIPTFVPRLLLFTMIFPILGGAVFLIRMKSLIRRNVYTVFLPLLTIGFGIIMNLVILYDLDIRPYYNDPRDISILESLKTADRQVFIFPLQPVLHSISYLWGLVGVSQKNLESAWKLVDYADRPAGDTTWQKLARRSYAVARDERSPLSTQEQNMFDYLSHGCHATRYGNFSVYLCDNP